MSDRPAGLTMRGWGLLATATGMAGSAYLFGIQELYGVAAAAVVLVAGARVWVSISRCNLTVQRSARPPRVPAGAEARIELAVTNVDSRPSPPVAAADPFDGGRRWARFAIAPLPPGERRSASYRLPTNQRGVFRLGPIQLEVLDPFGLARAVRRGGPDASVTVHPAFEVMPLHLLPSQSELDSSEPVHTAGRAGNEFFSLRPYDTGDDLRRVHWPSSARIDDLVVRQPEQRRDTRLTVAVDLRARVHDEASLEAVLSGCASIALSALSQGLQVRVVTSGGLDTGFNAGPGEGPIILDALAGAERHPGSWLPSTWRLLTTRDPLITVTTDGARPEDLVATLGRARLSNLKVVVFERRARAAGSAPIDDDLAIPGEAALRGQTIRVPPGYPLRKAWERARW